MRKIIILVVMLVAGYIGFSVARGFVDALWNSNSPRQIERHLQTMVTALNKEAPKQIDDLTTMEKVTAGPGLRIDYFYKIDASTNGLKDLPAFAARLKQQTLNQYKTSDGPAKLRAWKVETHHEYRDKDGNVVATFVIFPTDY